MSHRHWTSCSSFGNVQSYGGGAPLLVSTITGSLNAPAGPSVGSSPSIGAFRVSRIDGSIDLQVSSALTFVTVAGTTYNLSIYVGLYVATYDSRPGGPGFDLWDPASATEVTRDWVYWRQQAFYYTTYKGNPFSLPVLRFDVSRYCDLDIYQGRALVAVARIVNSGTGLSVSPSLVFVPNIRVLCDFVV